MRMTGVLLVALTTMTALAGCLDPVSLDVTARGDWIRWSEGSATWRCDAGGTVLEVTVQNDEGQVHRLDRDHWRFEWDGGHALRPNLVEGPREVTPDGTVDVRVYGCPPDDDATPTRLLLFDRDASDESAHLLAATGL